MPLYIPPPTWTQDGVTGNALFAEKPIQLACGPVTFADGTVLTMENRSAAGFLLFREAQGGGTEVWNEEAKAWEQPSGNPNPQPMIFQEQRWAGFIVAIGQKDSAGRNKMGTDPNTGYPRYFARCRFRGRDAQQAEQSGESVVTPVFQVFPMGDKFRAGLALAPVDPQTGSGDPLTATEIKIYLKDAGLTERGHILIREDGGGHRIELVVSGATITISPGGQIVLRPANGTSVRVEGDLEVTNHITRQGFNL